MDSDEMIKTSTIIKFGAMKTVNVLSTNIRQMFTFGFLLKAD